MLLHLDSTFRNTELYTYPSEFEIDFNGQPPLNNQVRDPRSLYITSDYAQFSFQWIGDTTLPGISTQENDALVIDYIAINPTTCILFNPSERIFRLENDYFVGLSFFDETTRLSAIVTTYNRNLLRITVNYPIFDEYFGSISPLELSRSSSAKYKTRQAYLVNFTFTTGNNLLVLGSTRLIPESFTEVALARGLNTNLWVQNITQRWTSKIIDITGQFRNVMLEEFPSYGSNDYFIIWRLPNSSGTSEQPLFIGGIWQFQVRRSTPGFQVGDVVVSSCNRARFRVLSVTREGYVDAMVCLDPGNLFAPSDIVILRGDHQIEKEVDIVVLNVANGMVAKTVPPKLIPGTKNDFLVAFLGPSDFRVLYYSIIDLNTENVFYLDISSQGAELFNRGIEEEWNNAFPFFLVPFSTVYPTINAPIVPYQNAVCYEVGIASISLPNLPVCGFEVLLADLPYVFVSLFNTNGPNNESYGTIISNNPNSNSANFLCPIANIRNPDTIKFVVVKSYQRVVFKFTPRNSLKFRITLPNGQLLRYAPTSVPYELACQGQDISGCPSLDQPLNPGNQKNNTVKVYPYELSNVISATFVFHRLGS